MKDYKTTIGASLLMLMIGLCPLIFTVIARVVTGSPTAEVYGLPVSYMIGGIFACIAAKKIFNVNVGDHIRKPELKIMLLIISAAVCYSVADITLSTEHHFSEMLRILILHRKYTHFSPPHSWRQYRRSLFSVSECSQFC